MIKEVELKVSLDPLSVVGKEKNQDVDWKRGPLYQCGWC